MSNIIIPKIQSNIKIVMSYMVADTCNDVVVGAIRGVTFRYDIHKSDLDELSEFLNFLERKKF